MLAPGARSWHLQGTKVLPKADPFRGPTAHLVHPRGLAGGTLGTPKSVGVGSGPVPIGEAESPFIAIRYACLSKRDHQCPGPRPVRHLEA
jgi:hypothetical protein